jgi:alpha-galactosidase
MAKVAIIGAGSVEFTRNILTDLGTYPELHGTLHLALHDIDAERLAYAERTANQVVERLGAGYRVSAHADRREAFDGADYLINEIQVGGYDATVRDFRIPARYGLRQTIADTIGIGGIMRGLRTIPVMIEMGNEMADLCPEGLLLNYTNPMAMVPWGIWSGSRWPAANTIGVCHSVRDTHSFLASVAGLRLREAIEADPEGLGRRVRVEIFRRFGYFPTESSEHSAEYVPWVLHLPGQVERFRSEIDEYIRRSDENLEEWAGLKAELDAGSEIELEQNNELASQYIFALETGTPIELYGNVRNDALIDGLPTDACVEVPVLVADGAVQPRRVGPIPPQCLGLNRTFLNPVELTVRAVVEGSREHVYHAALLDPNTAATLATDQIVNMVDDLLDAHGDLIPDAIRKG